MKESYRVKNVVEGSVTVDNVTLEKNESIGIVFLTDGVREAQAKGYITVSQTLTDADLIENLEEFISEMRTDNGVYPVGSVTRAYNN